MLAIAGSIFVNDYHIDNILILWPTAYMHLQLIRYSWLYCSIQLFLHQLIMWGYFLHGTTPSINMANKISSFTPQHILFSSFYGCLCLQFHSITQYHNHHAIGMDYQIKSQCEWYGISRILVVYIHYLINLNCSRQLSIGSDIMIIKSYFEKLRDCNLLFAYFL